MYNIEMLKQVIFWTDNVLKFLINLHLVYFS